MRIPDMMEEEEQIVGSSFDRFVILPTSGGYCATYPVPVATVRSMPTPFDRRDATDPSRFLPRIQCRTVMAAENIRKRLHA